MKTKNESDNYDYLFKIILVGDSCVGKTCLLSNWTLKQVPAQAVSTIGVEFATKIIKLQNGKQVKAQIWDTAGQERYRAITQAHYRQAEGAFLVYSICDYNTFQNSEMWLKELQSQAEEDCIITLIGNKLDLANERQVQTVEALNWSQQNKILFYETSAYNGENVETAFLNLLEQIFERKYKNENDQKKGENEQEGKSYNLMQRSRSTDNTFNQDESICCKA